MTVHFYRKREFFSSARSYTILVDNREISAIEVGKTESLDLAPGKHQLQVELAPLPRFYPWWGKIFTIITSVPKSNSVDISVSMGKAGATRYFVVGNWGSSLNKMFFRWLVCLFQWAQFKKKPEKLKLTAVNKLAFEKEQEKPMEGQPKQLPETPETKRLVLGEILIGILLIPFALFLYNQASGFVASMGMPLLLSGLNPFSRMFFWGNFSNQIPSYKSLRFRSALNIGVFAAVACFSLLRAFILITSILFLVFYSVIFVKAKQVFIKERI